MQDLVDVGHYRTHTDPMLVASGEIDHPTIHFEAPASKHVPQEMETFVRWFNKSMPGGKLSLSPLVRAGMAHLYFVCIHPYEDGNGRMGRAIAEKVLAQSLDQPSLIALARTLEQNKKNYYIRITKATPSTATRDLKDLVTKGALIRKGELKHTRYYFLNPSFLIRDGE